MSGARDDTRLKCRVVSGLLQAASEDGHALDCLKQRAMNISIAAVITTGPAASAAFEIRRDGERTDKKIGVLYIYTVLVYYTILNELRLRNPLILKVKHDTRIQSSVRLSRSGDARGPASANRA